MSRSYDFGFQLALLTVAPGISHVQCIVPLVLGFFAPLACLPLCFSISIGQSIIVPHSKSLFSFGTVTSPVLGLRALCQTSQSFFSCFGSFHSFFGASTLFDTSSPQFAYSADTLACSYSFFLGSGRPFV